MLADFDGSEERYRDDRAAAAKHDCAVTCDWESGRWALCCTGDSRLGGWAEDVSDVEIVSAIQELAETEGVFTETAGGVTTAVTARLYAHGRIQPNELTVTCITGNGLKTTDCLQGAYEQEQAIRPRLSRL